MKDRNLFTRFAEKTAHISGTPTAFILALITIIVWIVTGPMFNYSDTWQLVINTGTTIITFLMVFLIQNSQNRDTKAIHLKLDELIRVTEGAHTALLDLEELSERELMEICSRYKLIAKESRELLHQGKVDTHVPDVDIEYEKYSHAKRVKNKQK